jgi:hypothetical protein
MKRHRFDPFSALFGAVFTSVGIAFVLGSSLSQVRAALWPVVALIVGSTFVAWAVIVVVHDRRPRTVEAPAEDPSPDTDPDPS